MHKCISYINVSEKILFLQFPILLSILPQSFPPLAFLSSVNTLRTSYAIAIVYSRSLMENLALFPPHLIIW